MQKKNIKKVIHLVGTAKMTMQRIIFISCMLYVILITMKKHMMLLNTAKMKGERKKYREIKSVSN